MLKDSIMLNQIYEEFTMRKNKIEMIRKMEIEFERKKREEMKKFEDKNLRNSGEVCEFLDEIDKIKI